MDDSMSSNIAIILPELPHQPWAFQFLREFGKKTVLKQTLQPWFDKRPWLHYLEKEDAALCSVLYVWIPPFPNLPFKQYLFDLSLGNRCWYKTCTGLLKSNNTNNMKSYRTLKVHAWSNSVAENESDRKGSSRSRSQLCTGENFLERLVI